MSDGLSFDRLRSVNVERCERWHPGFRDYNASWTLADWSNAMCGEAGELANVVKKIRRVQTGTVNTGDPAVKDLIRMAGEELADVVTYVDLLAAILGIDLGCAVAEKFDAVSRRHGFPERLGTSDQDADA